MNRNQSDDVIVHDVSKEQQQEHKTNLNKTLFDRHAQIPTHQTFNTEQKDLAAVENWYRQQVENAKIYADERHQRDDLRRAAVYRVAGNLRDAHYALQLLHGRAPAEQFPHHAKRLCEVITGSPNGKLGRLPQRHSLVNNIVLI